MESEITNTDSPLFVDLDGTFIKTDMLYESLFIALKSNPFLVFFCLYWLLNGRANLKHQLAKKAKPQINLIPLNKELYFFLLREKEKGRKIILATASNEVFAQAFCDKYTIFNSCIGSDSHINLKGELKLTEIKRISENFSYAGNSKEDIKILEQAEEAYLVAPSRRTLKLASKCEITQIFDRKESNALIWFNQLRIHQWIKNTLIFVPILVAGEYSNIHYLLACVIGFFSFSFLASATYLFNDILDLESDRNHSQKRNRPLAAGSVGIRDALQASLLLITVSVFLALNINLSFFLALTIYFVITTLYSFRIKQHSGLDVLTLATLYTIRIFAGAFVLGIYPSFWLTSFSMFLFFSLALLKRCAEIKMFKKQGKCYPTGRGYIMEDYDILMQFGISSAVGAIVLFCLYIMNDTHLIQYHEPWLLWLILPPFSFWLMRMWLITHRGEMHEDPIIFSLEDRSSLVTISLMILIAVAAQKLGPFVA